MKIEEMLVLMDGTEADPNDVSRGDDGVWRHKNGVAVAMRADGRPETIGDRAALNGRAASREAANDAPRPVSQDQPASDDPTDGAAGGAGQDQAGEKPPSEQKPSGEAA